MGKTDTWTVTAQTARAMIEGGTEPVGTQREVPGRTGDIQEDVVVGGELVWSLISEEGSGSEEG